MRKTLSKATGTVILASSFNFFLYFTKLKLPVLLILNGIWQLIKEKNFVKEWKIMIYHSTLFTCFLIHEVQYNHALSLSLKSSLSRSLKIYETEWTRGQNLSLNISGRCEEGYSMGNMITLNGILILNFFFF